MRRLLWAPCSASFGCGEVSWMKRILVFEVAEGVENCADVESSAASQLLHQLFDTHSRCTALPPAPMNEGRSASCPSAANQMVVNRKRPSLAWSRNHHEFEILCPRKGLLAISSSSIVFGCSEISIYLSIESRRVFGPQHRRDAVRGLAARRLGRIKEWKICIALISAHPSPAPLLPPVHLRSPSLTSCSPFGHSTRLSLGIHDTWCLQLPYFL